MGGINLIEPSEDWERRAGTAVLLAILMISLIVLQAAILMPTAQAAFTPTASFTASPTSGCSPLTVAFTDSSSGNGRTITKWQWDFNGDGTFERTDTTKPAAFNYVYPTSGTFSAKLKVTTSGGTNTKAISIAVYGPPTAVFSGTPTSGCGPLAVTFTDASSGNSQTITKWEWDFNGDGTIDHTDTTTPAPFVYIYTAPGIYTPKLIVTTACGTNTSTKAAYIAVSTLPNVVPGSYGPVCASSGKITLGGTPAGGTWYGDGVVNNAFDPAATVPGDHLLTYVYVNSNGCNVSGTTTITVLPLPLTAIIVD